MFKAKLNLYNTILTIINCETNYFHDFVQYMYSIQNENSLLFFSLRYVSLSMFL